MKTFPLAAVGTVLIALCLAGCTSLPGKEATAKTAARKPASIDKTAKKTMHSFASEGELAAYLHKLLEQQSLRDRAAMGAVSSNTVEMQAAAPAASKDKSSDADESVTNVQHAGVDEGGIVKVHGDYLVVLRRGRLFTVSIKDGALAPVSIVDAFAPDIDPRATWYDEMLVSDKTIAVIGYSYERGGTEVGLFNIDGAGKLTYRSTYHLRSNDYYSSRNYASRLIGSKLIFYTPLQLNHSIYGADPFSGFPAVRR